MGHQFLQINQPLKAYAVADTTSREVTTLSEAKYEIVEIRKNYPTPDSDYVQIKDMDDQDVWVCLRFQNEVFADVVASEDDFKVALDDPEVAEDPEAIDESFLTDLLRFFSDFTYNLKTARYPFHLDGVSVPQAPPTYNNCCTFVEALTVRAWQNATEGFLWNSKKHGQMMIFSTEDYFSPVTCLIESNMASVVEDPDTLPAKWSVIQGWRKQWSGGHTFIILDHHQETDRILTLESNKAFKMDGVGFRNLGNYRDIINPEKEWWKNSSLPTWEKIKATYPFRKQCSLKVKNLDWI